MKISTGSTSWYAGRDRTSRHAQLSPEQITSGDIARSHRHPLVLIVPTVCIMICGLVEMDESYVVAGGLIVLGTVLFSGIVLAMSVRTH